MPSDYAAIREDHRRRWGEDVDDVGELFRDLYPDRTQFVFELLQNAQDAGASRIRFDLQTDRLEVRHNGRPFTEADVRGICGIKRSTKSDDPEQIGRFGIGFKSVYAYTLRPTVHCGDEHFAIEHYVHPHAVDPVAPGPDWSTLQVLPFDRADVSPEEAIAEIEPRLADLSPRTILFLRTLRNLEWAAPHENGGTISREEQEDGSARRVRLTDEGVNADADAEGEQWLLFERPVQLVPDRPPNRVEIAFLLTADGSAGERISLAESTELVAFFPTQRKTHLGFLAQGPFVTTPARDNVRERNPINHRLADELAELAVQAMGSVKERGLLDVGFLECLPIDVEGFPEGALLRPVYDHVRRALTEQPFLPTDDGRHLPATEMRLARGGGLRELFSPAQLGAILDVGRDIAWAAADISFDLTPNLYGYLVGYHPRYSFSSDDVPPLVPAMELTPDAIARRLQPSFLVQQTSEWMIRLYEWLAERRALIAELRERKIVRSSDGDHVAAFDDGGPRIWLPPPGETSYPIVDPTIAADERALEFFQKLGLTEPDVVDDVITSVLPRYQNGQRDTSVYESDLRRIAAGLRAAVGEKQRRLFSALDETPFLVGRNAATGERRWLVAGELYEPTDELAIFLDGNPNAWILCDECLVDVDCWRSIGVASDFRVIRETPDYRDYVIVRSRWGWHERGLDGFDPRFEIVDLDHAVAHPTIERSLVVWKLLARENVPVQGSVEKSTTKTYTDPTVASEVSPVGMLVTSRAWLLGSDGSWRTPKELSLDELDPAFRRDEGLAIRLQMQPTAGREIAGYLDIEPDDLELLRRNPDLLRDAVASARRADLDAQGEEASGRVERETQNPETEEAEVVDINEAIRAAFSRPGQADPEEWLADGRASNPARRRERGAEALREAQASEPDPNNRRRVVARKELEPRDPGVREYLEQMYRGECQICGSTFPRWDGKPFFEAKYLVSPTAARWLDTPGNSLCLCPTCLAKWLHGSVAGPDPLGQLTTLAEKAADLPDGASIQFELCGEAVEMRFAQRHLIDLGLLLES